MPGRALNNVTTANAYTRANTIEEPRGFGKLNLIVANAAVYFQVATDTDTPAIEWAPEEEFLVPGFYNRVIACKGARVRSAAAGVPAQVTVRGL